MKLTDGFKIRPVLLGIVFVSFTCFSRSDAASFQGIGGNMARAVSADGSVVVGFSISGWYEAFHWTKSGGMQMLGLLPEDSFWSEAVGVSADGSVVIGTAGHDFPPVSGKEAYRWTESGGMVGLGWLRTYPLHVSQGTAVSADGAVVVGASLSTSYKYEAFRWTQSSGMVGLDNISGGNSESWACGISSDGLTVVGFIDSNAFRWTQSEGMVKIGGGVARDASDDGSVIVGNDGRWTESGGWHDIGFHAYGVSGDGSVVVGNGAFIWDEEHGTRNLKDVLENDYGVPLAGWTLTSAEGVSADGLTIVGFGTNPNGQREAWIAKLGNKPGYLTGDLTGDGSTNFKDFAKLAYYWLQDEFFVDIVPLPNGDGIVDFQELAVLAEHWLENFYEDFETGDFSKYYWQHHSFNILDGSASDLIWNVVSDVVHEGNYSARSAVACDYQVSALEITLDTDCNHISFWRKVSCNPGLDFLRFFIDGVKQDDWDGEHDWALETYTITPGEHTFSWYYVNNSGRFGIPPGGSNCAWIDNVRLYSASTE